MSLMAAGRNAELFLPVHITHTNALFCLVMFFTGQQDHEINVSVIAGADETK